MSNLPSRPKSYSESPNQLIHNVERGEIKIPTFQREFVWPLDKSAALIDSILKNYPVGSLMFWRTKVRLSSLRSIGRIALNPELDGREYLNYVLDGQQRITSLLACLKGLKIEIKTGTQKKPTKKILDFSKIYIDLSAISDEQIVVTDQLRKELIANPDEDKNEDSFISVCKLYNLGFKDRTEYNDEHAEKIEKYQRLIETYDFPIIQVDEHMDIVMATDLFTRVNTRGKALSIFEIMVAKTYEDRKFDLAEKYTELKNELETHGYEKVSQILVLQVVSILLKQACNKPDILSIENDEMHEIWGPACKAIKAAIEYFRASCQIKAFKLLPYTSMMIPFACFFHKHPHQPTGKIQDYLQDFFWRCAFSDRYAAATLSSVVKDIKKIDDITKGKKPDYDWKVDTSVEFIKKIEDFDKSSNYIRAILCLYASKQPKNFDNGSFINLDAIPLTKSSLKNNHHFFPKGYLDEEPKYKDHPFANHILNISFIRAELNQGISKKAPSEYMKKYSNDKNLNDTMKSHLIGEGNDGDLDKFGVWDDDFEKFINARAKLVSKEIESKIIR